MMRTVCPRNELARQPLSARACFHADKGRRCGNEELQQRVTMELPSKRNLPLDAKPDDVEVRLPNIDTVSSDPDGLRTHSVLLVD